LGAGNWGLSGASRLKITNSNKPCILIHHYARTPKARLRSLRGTPPWSPLPLPWGRLGCNCADCIFVAVKRFSVYKFCLASALRMPSPRQGKGDRVPRWMRMPYFNLHHHDKSKFETYRGVCPSFRNEGLFYSNGNKCKKLNLIVNRDKRVRKRRRMGDLRGQIGKK